MQADGAILGASIRTLDDERPAATALAWRDGVLVAVGLHRVEHIETLVDSDLPRFAALNVAASMTEAAKVVGDVTGRLSVGPPADITACAADPVDVDADELPDVPVRLTLVGGEAAFEAR